ncbi:helicase-related protein [Mesorhizobium captivum]|uniref:helicase-related protein n=1 Tax=Mesorhizobium captivum TaxID=3072319 RepID=UPI002A2421D1|nr:helicase-related protein [Mesorhizobium sp. VK23E]MDX8510496.1 helicase-related protein [Mesorhizobium sp. VK23E]
MSSIRSGIRDNRRRGAASEFVVERAIPGSQLSVVSAYFTTFAYDRLRETLDHVGGMRFLFGEPRFLKEADSAGLVPPAFSIGEDGLRLTEQLRQRAVALRCARWIRERVEVRSVKRAGLLHGKLIHVDDGRRGHALVGSSNFTTNGLGLGEAPNIELNLVVDGDRDREDLLAWFDELWTDTDLTEDVRNEVLRVLEATYVQTSPEFVYFTTLFHLFGDYLAERAEEEAQFKQTAFEKTAIWQALFDFQRDGLRAILSKLERHGGCILADSVGLGKTYTALAVIKWYEKRNKNVLVLCPKKLRENWTDYLAVNNSGLNPLREDRFGYTVLSHTDLAREKGKVGDIDLSKIEWGNYDLVVIDESHNFRNASRNKSAGGRVTRYARLMDDIVKAGLPTKVLQLSATPVNNDLSDLKAQLDLISADRSDGFSDLGVPNLSGLIGQAQRKFADWAKSGSGDAASLLTALPPALFGLLDGVTIARSRKHVERHYAASMERIGNFSKRAAPESIFANIDRQGGFPAFEAVDDAIGRLELALYSPLAFVLPKHRHLYDKGGNFDQGNREKYLIAMMKSGFLKRLESSVSSFRLSMDRMIERIDRRVSELDAYSEAVSIDNEQDEEEDLDEELEEAFEVGSALKYRLVHIDRPAWKAALLRDRERIVGLADAARLVTPEHDLKLEKLAEIIRQKAVNPSMNRNGDANRKIILFTAFTDTARYLYEQLLPLAKEFGLEAALVTGAECKATFGRAHFQDVLVNFAPRAKRRADMKRAVQSGEIDLLVATDCISEGQNLQDADLLVNVDIHWNPVRLIQRFGRIDRIGSLNDTIRMVNFWPTEELNKYLKLKGRVEARMRLVDLSATGEDDLLNKRVEAESDLRWRDEQLLRLRDEVFDLEDATGGVTLADFALDDFRADLRDFVRANGEALHDAPLGLHAVVPNAIEGGAVDPGVIFCLRRRPADPDPDQTKINPLDPFYLVHVKDDGAIRFAFGQPKPILGAWRALCLGHAEPFEALCNAFDDETEQGERLERYDALIAAAVASIGQTSASRTLAALTGTRGAKVPNEASQARASSEYDLITWLVVRPSAEAAGAILWPSTGPFVPSRACRWNWPGAVCWKCLVITAPRPSHSMAGRRLSPVKWITTANWRAKPLSFISGGKFVSSSNSPTTRFRCWAVLRAVSI